MFLFIFESTVLLHEDFKVSFRFPTYIPVLHWPPFFPELKLAGLLNNEVMYEVEQFSLLLFPVDLNEKPSVQPIFTP